LRDNHTGSKNHRMEIRHLRSEEGLLYRELRLRALADAPDAFGDTLSDALARPEQWWIDRAYQVVHNSEREALFMAWDQEEPCGLVYARLEDAVAHLYGMWVAPAVRRQGNGAALLNASLSWARTKGAERAELWVTDGNVAATRLYESLGFRQTGLQEPIRPGSAIRVCQMILNLADDPV
jgi:GNAT superfamily N-acetyltransferase